MFKIVTKKFETQAYFSDKLNTDFYHNSKKEFN
jgi:hypothetical protein